MRSHGKGKTDMSRGFWYSIGIVLGAIGLTLAVFFTLMSCDSTWKLLQPPFIDEGEDYDKYIVSLTDEKRADCNAPYFILIGEVTNDVPIEMISVKRQTHPLKSPDRDAAMEGSVFRLVGPPIQRGQTDRFDLKVTLADTNEQVTVGHVFESAEDCMSAE